MTDHPECSCPSLHQLTRLGLEGKPIPECNAHRPDVDNNPDALALNDDHLAATLTARLGGTETTTL